MVLTAREKDCVRSYQYHGGDSSYIYKFILSPFAQGLVDFCVPSFIAPNVITLSGLVISAVAMTLTLVYNPQLSCDCPRWLHLFTGICIFCYQTLDNMDGKQARKTGSSSSLGLLFDHGCDAINAGVTAIPMASVLGTGWTIGLFFSLWSAFVPFYFQTWEEYYAGSMVLPLINGPTEGLLIAVGICLTSYHKSSAWWHVPLITIPQWIQALIPSEYSSLLLIDETKTSPFRLIVLITLVGATCTAIGHVLKGTICCRRPLF